MYCTWAGASVVEGPVNVVDVPPAARNTRVTVVVDMSWNHTSMPLAAAFWKATPGAPPAPHEITIDPTEGTLRRVTPDVPVTKARRAKPSRVEPSGPRLLSRSERGTAAAAVPPIALEFAAVAPMPRNRASLAALS